MPGTALLVIDAQRNMLEGPDALPNAEIMIARLRGALDLARRSGRLVVFIQNDGASGDVDEPFSVGWELFFEPQDDEWVVTKTTLDVFESNPALAAELAATGIETLVVVGMQSEYCLQESCLGAVEAGFDVQVPSALHATYDTERRAADIAADVELVLTAAGVTIT
ncbi:isochorismatase family protein [Frondihabitans australicus]|uniref:Nicotinamidase-related amidase n=1 Tax=Frondihabitans australicus TaxID=386892 RepID=A0A495IF10_9MICO|nr:isochorismatase family protein [Frondihabitans australicus]RKR74577.1 nicotinamidase-related amidase [Frondihabitans australicus]